MSPHHTPAADQRNTQLLQDNTPAPQKPPASIKTLHFLKKQRNTTTIKTPRQETTPRKRKIYQEEAYASLEETCPRKIYSRS
jgi:hypothetical protein